MFNFIRKILLVNNMLFIIKTCYAIYSNCYSSRLHTCFFKQRDGCDHFRIGIYGIVMVTSLYPNLFPSGHYLI